VDDDDVSSSVLRLINGENQEQQAKEFQAWCTALEALPPDFELKLAGNLKADIELQPFRWMSSGIDFIESAKVTARVELTDGVQGPVLSSYLPYGVFHMGTEIFFKGMWLCQYTQCRSIGEKHYVDAQTRAGYGDGIKNLGHDLIKIVGALRRITEYQTASMLRFLKIVEGIVRQYYFPLYEADKRTRWADSRYPKRFYDDFAGIAHADNLHRYPQQELIVRVFKEAETEVDKLWGLRDKLIAEKQP
jgi:hypothetical protein